MPTETPSHTTGHARSALLALLLVVPAPSLGVWAAMVAWPGPVGTAIFVAAKAWMLLVPAAWLLLVDRERLSLSPARRGGFGPAVLIGAAAGAAIVLAYALLGDRWIDADHVQAMAKQNGIGIPAGYLAAAAYWILVNSVLEEYVYRWFIFRRCEALLPPLAAVAASGLCFTLHHVIALKVQFDWNVTVLASVGIFVGGAMWSWLYLRYRSIWPAYLSHAIVDVVVFAVGWRIIFG